jgi:hypothetical protein
MVDLPLAPDQKSENSSSLELCQAYLPSSVHLSETAGLYFERLHIEKLCFEKPYLVRFHFWVISVSVAVLSVSTHTVGPFAVHMPTHSVLRAGSGLTWSGS